MDEEINRGIVLTMYESLTVALNFFQHLQTDSETNSE